MESLQDIFSLTMEVKEGGLQCIVLGPSGSGKSHLAGTYPGKTLYLCGDSERHGVKSANKEGGENIIPVCWSRRKNGDVRSADGAYKFINELIQSPEQLKEWGIKFIVVDSLIDLLKTIRNTQVWSNKCLTPKGTHNSFAEPDAYVDMVDKILSQLRHLCDSHDIDFMVTADLEVQEHAENGLILQSKPRLPSFSVAERVIQQFPDVIMLGRIKTKSKSGPVIQMGAGCSRVSKNEHGTIVKTLDFTPRLSDVEEIPAMIKADLKEVLKLKEK